MLNITSKGIYGILAVLELADNYGKGLMQVKDIAEKHDIPKTYLFQLFNRLLKFGLVRSERGSKGGYELSASPADIRFLRVLEALEGPMAIGHNYPENDAVKDLFFSAQKELTKIWDVSLNEILLKQQAYTNNLIFHI